MDTGAAVVNDARTSAVDKCGELSTLAVLRVGVCLHRGVQGFAGGVGVEID